MSSYLPQTSGGGSGSAYLPPAGGAVGSAYLPTSGVSTPTPAAAAKPASRGGLFDSIINAGKSLVAGGVTLGSSLLKPPPGGVLNAWEHPFSNFSQDPLTKNVLAPVAKQYSQTYGPLFEHGSLSGIEKNKFGFAMDLLTLASAGAGIVGKGADVARAAGATTKIGLPVDLTAPDFAAKAGQAGAQVVLKQSSANPFLKTLQVGKNAALNKLPDELQVGGRTVGIPGSPAARVTRALSREPARAAARMTILAHPFDQAFNRLNPAEKAAWHLKAQAVHPDEYAKLLLRQGDAASPGMLKTLLDQKVIDAYENPSARLQKALTLGSQVADHLTKMKVAAGDISETAAAESPYRLLRFVNGAKPEKVFEPLPHESIQVGRKVIPTDRKNVGMIVGTDPVAKTAAVHFFNRSTGLQQTVSFPFDELMRGAGQEIRGGPDIQTLAHEIAAKGHEQPFYVPHSADTGNLSGLYRWRAPQGFSEPAVTGASRQNLGILARQGKLAFNQNPLMREWTLYRGRVEARQIHDALVEHAAMLPKGQPLPLGYEYLKLNRGESSLPYTEQIGNRFEHGIDPKFVDNTFTRDPHDEAIMGDDKHSLVVPTRVKSMLTARQLKTPNLLYRLLYAQPSSVWKHLVIGLRPASFVNITGGNSILGMLQAAPRYGVSSWLRQVTGSAKRLTDETMSHVLPEQKLGTFGVTSGFGSTGGATRLTRGLGRAYQGVMPATIGYENVLRRAMTEGWARYQPEVRAALRTHGGDINQAIREVAKTHPHVLNEISQRVDDALGNYRSYNAVERQIRQLIPFYGWDRHVIRSVARLAKERPGLLDSLFNLGQVGEQSNQSLGPLPSFLEGASKLPGLPSWMGPLNGRTPLLETQSVNPFATAADIAGLATNKGSSEIAGSLNPIVQALIEQFTGTSLLTGAPLPKSALGGTIPEKIAKVAENAAGGVPQVILGKSILSGPQSKPGGLFQNDWQSELANILGIKVKKTNMSVAQAEAAKGR